MRYVAVSAGRWPRMTDKATSDLWWKDGVIYCADVATWVDSDGDGVMDLDDAMPFDHDNDRIPDAADVE